ncbi:MAG: recombinase family protein [Bacteroidetes bacterium]|jgi:hypothetical protein|nr:recombinase family protein [Bacteroidota bacterium]
MHDPEHECKPELAPMVCRNGAQHTQKHDAKKYREPPWRPSHRRIDEYRLRDLLTLIDDVLGPEGAAFVSVTEQFDTKTAQGRLFMQMIGSFAEFERNIITERLTEGRRIFQMREAGETLRAIASRLNREGVPTKRGGDWHASTVSYVLKNPKYRGLLRCVIGEDSIQQDRPDLAVTR